VSLVIPVRLISEKAHNQDMDGVLFFDGKCGMCTRARNGLLRLNRTGRLRTETLQKPGTAERLGVPPEQLMQSSWWLGDSGEVFGGAKAVNAAVSAALGTKLPLRVYGIPGVRAVEERVYRWVATHRYRFRGVTPYCETVPAEC
jgi:predicted DCC family thiol-disulfide oxidoreductase YuxK